MTQYRIESGAKYMEHARRCVVQAQSAHTTGERLSFLEMAQEWAHLSEQADQISHLVDEARGRGLLPHKSEMH
jgi:hypothetical protein